MNNLPNNPHILVFGAGFIGIPMAAALAADLLQVAPGKVTLADVDPIKVQLVNDAIAGQSGPPILGEPNLRSLLNNAIRPIEAVLISDLDVSKSLIDEAHVIFVCVPTKPIPIPPQSQIPGLTKMSGASIFGDLDCSLVANLLAQCIDVANETGKRKLVIVRSTLSLAGVAGLVDLMSDVKTVDFVYAPEFLVEGDAVAGITQAQRLVIGTRNADAAEGAMQCIAPEDFNEDHVLVECIPEEAALIKLGANALLATKVAFATRMAKLVEQIGDGDFSRVRDGICSDPRIGRGAFHTGLGPAGPCLIKDTAAYSAFIDEGLTATLVLDTLKLGHHWFANLLQNLKGRVVFFGAGFKPTSPDLRWSQVVSMFYAGCVKFSEHKIAIWDPRVIDEDIKLQKEGVIEIARDSENRTINEDDILWNNDPEPFLPEDWEVLVLAMNQGPYMLTDVLEEDVTYDGNIRQIYDPFALLTAHEVQTLKDKGFSYHGGGRGKNYPVGTWQSR